MNPAFEDFCQEVILTSRQSSSEKSCVYDGVDIQVNNLELRFPTQLFINGKFVNSASGQTLDCINPADESLICQVIKPVILQIGSWWLSTIYVKLKGTVRIMKELSINERTAGGISRNLAPAKF